MRAILKISETGTVVAEGAQLHHKDGTRWKFEGIVFHKGDHFVKVSRFVNRHIGRMVKLYMPHLFGCHVEAGFQITFRNSVHRVLTFGTLGEMKNQTLILLYAGVLALIPLALFEHYHLANHLFDMLGNKSATKGD